MICHKSMFQNIAGKCGFNLVSSLAQRWHSSHSSFDKTPMCCDLGLGWSPLAHCTGLAKPTSDLLLIFSLWLPRGARPRAELGQVSDGGVATCTSRHVTARNTQTLGPKQADILYTRKINLIKKR